MSLVVCCHDKAVEWEMVVPYGWWPFDILSAPNRVGKFIDSLHCHDTSSLTQPLERPLVTLFAFELLDL